MKMPIHDWLTIVGLCLILGLACRGSADSASSQQAPEGWVTHRDPSGFSVQTPRGWNVRPDPSSGRIEIRGAHDEQLIVWPFFAHGSLQAPTASDVLQRIAARLWPDARWERPKPAGATAVRLRGRAGDRAAVSVLTWVPGPQGTAGYIYAASALESSYRQSEALFARILQSFHISGGASKASSPSSSLKFTRWQDPTENAFSLDVPSGWKVNGGISRPAPLDVRSAVEAASPDGQIRVISGDWQWPRSFLEPNPIDDFQGYTEGSWKPTGYGGSVLIWRYQPGAQFARDYVHRKLGPSVTGLQFTDARERPDLTQAINTTYAQYASFGIQASANAGEVAFTCRSGEQSLQGYYLAVTTSVRGERTGIWTVDYLLGYIAADSRAAEAQAALTQLIKSAQLNPQWLAREQQNAAAATRIITQTNAQISQMMFETNREWARSRDEMNRRWVNAIAGTEDVIDPQTGEQFNIYSGSNYYWINDGRVIAGTNTYNRPDIDFREMIRLP
jgi:hypothetical protein